MIIVMLMTECFPGSLQSICTGVIEGVGQIGAALGPVVITLCINLKIHPMIILSIICLVFIVLPFFWMVEPKHQDPVKPED
jgi:nitrate/nitrite transporter NarK